MWGEDPPAVNPAYPPSQTFSYAVNPLDAAPPIPYPCPVKMPTQLNTAASPLPMSSDTLSPELNALGGNTYIGQATSTSTAAGSRARRPPKNIPCGICGKMFDRHPRAKACENKHNGISGYPCIGVCGDPTWYV